MKSLVWHEVVFFSNLKKSHKITVDYNKNQIGYLLELEECWAYNQENWNYTLSLV